MKFLCFRAMVVVFAAYTVGLEYHFRMKAFNLNTMDLDYSQWLDNQFLIQQYNNVPDDVLVLIKGRHPYSHCYAKHFNVFLSLHLPNSEKVKR